VLQLTPELWTLALPHRTQILYAADISLILLRLLVRPGSVIVESGTGSGSLTHALARGCAPHGAVHTFEYHAERAAKARSEFAAHGLGGLVHTTHRDVVAHGFLKGGAGAGAGAGAAACSDSGGVEPGSASGVSLDLPNPWLAVQHAVSALGASGVLCSFSPCIEQVQRTAAAMAAAGLEDVRTYESLLRPMDVTAEPLLLREPSQLMLQQQQQQQQQQQRVGGAGAGAGATGAAGAAGSEEAAGAGSAGAKRQRSEQQPEGAAGSAGGSAVGSATGSSGASSSSSSKFVEWPQLTQQAQQPLCEPSPSKARGHTGYLTFATLWRKKA
jgi:tRNA (adenine57-N1/adenine58-N1)-methyltransferase